MAKTRTYRELDAVSIPEDVPELGDAAGDGGVISTVWAGGKMLNVEIPRAGGASAGFIDLEVQSDGSMKVVGYSKLSG